MSTAESLGAAVPAGEDVVLVDSTLRDGSHAVEHQVTPQQVRDVVSALDASGVRVIEVSHGDGIGGSSFNYGFGATGDVDLVRVAAETARRARIAVLLLPGIGVADDLRRVHDVGATVARIATHCTEADISDQHIRMARELGMTAVGFLMMAHMTTPEELLAQARKMESYGAEAVYVTDSAGALTPNGIRARVAKLRSGLDVPVGVHAHNNLQLAVANSVAAFEEGATWIDGTGRGMGAGAGNTPLEILATVFDREGVATGVDIFRLMDAAEEIVAPMLRRPQIVDRAGLLLGYAGIYSSFLLHSERAALRFDVDLPELLLELGRRRVVGGQEDMILDVAAWLAGGRSAVDEAEEPTPAGAGADVA
jgi:4-hydroxy 2-oxovalerate aldolase